MRARRGFFKPCKIVNLIANLQNSDPLTTHAMRGQLFETWVMSELIKKNFNQGLRSNLYFWRDSQGHEIDALIDQGDLLIPIEIKSGQTINSDYFKGIIYWQELSGQKENAQLIYAGADNQIRNQTQVISWKNLK